LIICGLTENMYIYIYHSPYSKSIMLFNFLKTLFRKSDNPSINSNDSNTILPIDMVCELDNWLYDKQARYTETDSDWDGVVHTEGFN